jgi:hypothetical protein
MRHGALRWLAGLLLLLAATGLLVPPESASALTAWTIKTSMTTPRYEGAATMGQQGPIYALGGQT